MKKFGLIGRQLSHSFSPEIHRMLGDYEYRLYPMEPQLLANFLRDTELDGFNVTIPYKQTALPLCSALSDRAAAIGCVNTMVRLPNGGWFGDNTDYDGFLYLLGEDAAKLQGQQALVLGSGGASRTVRRVLEDCGIHYTVISRSGKDSYDTLSRHSGAAMIVNTTPVGMYPDNGAAPVDLRRFPQCRLVLDLIYNPAKTALLLQAEALGIPARNGLSMLSAQAVRASERFCRRTVPDEQIALVTEAIRRQTRNIALIGMPGCGKTTVAQQLHLLTGRPVVDTDAQIVQLAGMEIPEIFRTCGEAYFRTLETQVLRDVSRQSGCILATGGGIVTVPENLPLLRQNSICVFLDCDKRRLDVSGRPLSQAMGVDALLKARLPLYQSWSDAVYFNADPAQTAQKIKEELL